MDIGIGSQLFINNIDAVMQNKIIQLDHELRIIRREMEAKLNDNSFCTEQATIEKEHISRFIKDIDLAIDSIKDVVDLVSGCGEDRIIVKN